MKAIISNGDYTASVQLPVERRQLAGALAYLGAIHASEYDIKYNEESDKGLSFTLEEHFRSPSHAVDIVKRLLHHSGMIIDNATPIAQGHLPNNTRITAIKSPVVDEEAGISVSIRLLHPQRVDRAHLIKSGMATEEMIAFLEMCIRYGVSIVVAGRTSSGKTTLILGFGESVFPVTINASASGISQVYWNGNYRTLQYVDGNWQFIQNTNAADNERIHFIPVWFTDGNYTVSVTATRVWTPIGMIEATRTANTITIDGSIYDDYFVGN